MAVGEASMKTIPLTLILLLTFLSGCNLPQTKLKPQVTIVVSQLNPPPTCLLSPNETISVAPKGMLPANSRVSWRVHGGGIISDTSSLSTLYTAPAEPSDKPVEIIATIFSSNDELVEVVQVCMIVAAPAATDGSLPDSAVTPEAQPAAAASTKTPTQPAEPKPATTLAAASPNGAFPAAPGTIAITEVMGNPCGKQNEELANEYVELYNYSDQAVDLAGVYMMTSNQQEFDLPDQLVAWKTRNTIPAAFANLVTDTTVLQPKQYALILEPNYHLTESGDKMPYKIPAGTLTLTVANKNRLGNAVGGLISSGRGPRDSIYLYTGTAKRVEQILTTYAVLKAGPYPFSVGAPYNMPLETGECQSIHRRTVPCEDKFENWLIGDGTPGSGPY
ncbi:MAG: hypothetical protein EHM21_00545 [Chloroflexi bacterium]|nr:MAG: hypothetical protein EHM21_00545 [Chloroflexota bacterium]